MARRQRQCRLCGLIPTAFPRSPYCVDCRAWRAERRALLEQARFEDMASTSARGYGNRHQQLRKAWTPQVDRGEVDCARCGRPIEPGTPWDLDHDDHDRTQYLGPSHAACNRATRFRKAKRRRQPAPMFDPPRHSRQWP